MTSAPGATPSDFPTRTGQRCDDVRQDFVLLSDELGISALVEDINHRTVAGATEATVLGLFHMTRQPVPGLRCRLRGEEEPGA